jgi:hypothetical protein
MAQLKDGTRIYGNANVNATLTTLDLVVTGNMSIQGTTTTVDTTVTTLKDPVITLGAESGQSATNDGLDRGIVLKYNDGTAQTGFMGWDQGNQQFAFASTTTFVEATNSVTITGYGDVHAGIYYGNAYGLDYIVGANVSGDVYGANAANYAVHVTGNAQGNITSVGTLSSLAVGTANALTIDANGNIDTSGAITTSGSITANGAHSNLTIGTSGANNSVANIYGDLNVTGNVTGRFTGSVSAKGANTEIQFNDDGNQNATGGFTFTKSSNTVTIGTNITLDGDNGNANLSGSSAAVNLNGGRLDSDGGSGIQLYSTGYAQLAYNNDNYVYVQSGGVYLETNGGTVHLDDSGVVTIPGNLQTDNNNFSIDDNGNVLAQGTGTFSDVYITNASNTYVLYANGTQVYGDGSFTYDYGPTQLLTAGNISTFNADIQGNITTKYTAGKLLTTDVGGNLIESNVSFSSDTLNVANANISNTASIGNLTITSLITQGALLFTGGAGGNVDESANLSFNDTTKTLTTDNVTATGTANVGNLIVNNLTNHEIPYANSTSGIEGDAAFTYTASTSTLNAPTITANNNISTTTGNVSGANIIATTLGSTQVVYSDASGVLKGTTGFTFASDTLTANTINAATALHSANIYDTDLSLASVVFAGADGLLSHDTGFAYYTGNTTLTSNNVNVTNTVTADTVLAGNIGNSSSMLYGNGHNITGVTASSMDANNLTGTTLASSVNNSNLTSFGTVANITMAGTGNISGGNNVSANTFTGTLTTNSQPNITSLGTLTGLTVDGNISITGSGNGIKTDNLYYANGNPWDLQQAAGSDTQIQYNSGNNFAASSNFTFDPTSSLFKVTGNANITNTLEVSNVNVSSQINLYEGSSIYDDSGLNINGNTSVGIYAGGTTNDIEISANNYTLTLDHTGNLTFNGNVADLGDELRVGNANVTGYLKAGDTTIAGNLVVTGTTTSVNTTVTQLTDPLFDLGNGANGAPLTSDDGMDRGLIMHTYSMGSAVDVFMGYKDNADEFVLAKNVTVTNNVVDYGTTDAEKQANLADVRMGNIFAYNANFGGTVFSNGNITLGAGSFMNGNVNGNISGNITVGGPNGALQFASNATYDAGNGVWKGGTLSYEANLTYVSGVLSVDVGTGGNVVADYLTGALTTNAQPNITSVGLLSNLDIDMTLNVACSAVIANSSGIFTDGYYYANGDQIDFQTASGNAFELQFHADGANDLAASSSLTFNPTTSNLTVNGNIITGTGSGGNITGANVVSATLFVGSGANLTNINGANVSEVALATNVTASAQSNITSVGTLTSLTVADAGIGNILADNINVVTNGQIGSSGMYLYGDGSNITGVTASSIDANNLTGTTLASGVTNSSLTSVGTLGSLSVTNDITVSAGDVILTLGSVYANAGTIKGDYLTGTLTTASQPNVTSVGTLTSLSVSGAAGSGNITADNIFANSGIIKAGYFYGDGSNISSITGGNVTGWVEQANVANVAYAVSAGNITGTTLNASVVTSSLTTVGTLGNLSVTGNITATTGNIVAGNIGNATTMLYGNGYNITGVTASSMDANNLTGTTLSSNVLNSSLTSVGTLNGLTANSTIDFTTASNVALGDVANVHITGGTSGQYLQTNGSGIVSWSTVELANIHNGTSNVAVDLNGNVTAVIAGSTIITIATTGLTVTGIIEATGNILGNNLTSNHYITANGTEDATDAMTGAIHSAKGISAEGNIYTGNVVGFAVGGGNTDSAAYIKYNSTAGSLDFIFN